MFVIKRTSKIEIVKIEKKILLTKAIEFIDNPISEFTLKEVDALATNLIYNMGVINLKSLGGPLQQDHKHTLEDSDKISNTGVDILLQCLQRYLRASIETAKKLKSYSIQIIGMQFFSLIHVEFNMMITFVLLQKTESL